MRIAVVTGASSGMGRDFVLALDRDYSFDEIWVIARRNERLVELGSMTKTKVVPVVLDLSQKESASVLENMLRERNVKVGALVNAAGYGVFKAFEESSREEMEGIVDLNDRALVSVTSVVLPFMEKGSFIINLGSNSSHQPVPYIATYAASKAFANP